MSSAECNIHCATRQGGFKMKQMMLKSGILAVAVATIYVPQARAQGPERDAVTLDNVMVTAERRSVDIQQMPTAVSVISGEQLAAKAITRMEDLAHSTPTLSFTDTGATQTINIRGIGIASSSPSVQNGVSIYQDGVFQLPILQSNMFYDIESIEVLRGPQGTLAGNNSTGGAIFINTIAPEIGRTGGYVELRAGNHGERGFQSGFDIPAGQYLAFRVASNYRERDSYYRDVGTINSGAGSLEERALRIGGLFEVNNFSALLRGERIMRDMGGIAYRPIPGTTFAPGRTDNIREISYNTPGFRNEDASTVALELRQKLAGGTVVRYVGSWADRLLYYWRDSDATTLANLENENRAASVLRTHELNFISDDSSQWNWVGGLYWQEEKVQHRSLSLSNTGFPTRVNNNDPIKSIRGIFGNVNYHLSPAFELQAGLRYSESKTSNEKGNVTVGAGVPGFPENGTVVAELVGRSEDDGVSGKVALNWTPNQNNLVYASVARGYKSGGFNSANSVFDPEFVLNYELGWKTTALGGRLRSQMNVFYSDYKGFQFDARSLLSGRTGVRNFDDGKVQGVEAQFQGIFGEYGDFRVDAAVAFVDSKMAPISFVNERLLPPGVNVPQCAPGQDPSTGTCFEYGPYIQTNNGGVNLYSPEWSINLGAEYEIAMDNGWSLTPRINYGYLSDQYVYLSYSDQTDRLPSRGLVSALLTLRLPRNVLAEVYGTNLADREYVSGQMGDNEFYGPPREYGMRVRFNF